MVRHGHERIIVLEDDVRFTGNGTLVLRDAVEDLARTHFGEWDLIYLGRKRICSPEREHFVPGHRHLSTACYSHWTLGYALSLAGAKKVR